MSELTTTRSISNLGLSRRRAFLTGVKGTRKFIEQAGADGLAWTPLNSLLKREIRHQARTGEFRNNLGGVALIGWMDQTFAPTLKEIVGRDYERRQKGEGVVSRTLKIGREVLERVAMPSSVKSLSAIESVAIANVQGYVIPANVYVDRYGSAERFSAPVETSVQLSADTLENLGNPDMFELPGMLREQGIYYISFSSYNTERNSLTGETQVPDWQEWLPQYAKMGLIRQVAVSLGRTDLPDETGIEAAKRTHVLGDELIKDEPDLEKLGDLPDQLRTIVENTSSSTLDISLRGPLKKYKPKQIRKIFENLENLAGISRPLEN